MESSKSFLNSDASNSFSRPEALAVSRAATNCCSAPCKVGFNPSATANATRGSTAANGNGMAAIASAVIIWTPSNAIRMRNAANAKTIIPVMANGLATTAIASRASPSIDPALQRGAGTRSAASVEPGIDFSKPAGCGKPCFQVLATSCVWPGKNDYGRRECLLDLSTL